MNNEIKTISPFRNFCITIGALPTSYLESMSYYEMLAWLCKYLENTVNPAINQNAEALKELQEYVSNYFENLDVQEEINNKLDEMADDGTLAEIINVEMIGNLSNLTTTNKSNLVSAINEVNTISDYINLVSYVTYTDNAFELASGNLDEYSRVTVARNSAGTLCKIYGKLTVENLENNGSKTIELNVDTGLRPSSDLYITGTSFNFGSAGISEASIKIKTNGYLEIGYYAASTQQTILLPACLIFVKDFGDTPS